MIPRLGRNRSHAAGTLVALVVVLVGVAPALGLGSAAGATGMAPADPAGPTEGLPADLAGVYPQTQTLNAVFDPNQAPVGEKVQLFIEGSPGADIRISSPGLTDTQVEKLLADPNRAVTLDSGGEWSKELFVTTDIEPGQYEFVFTDVDTGAETTAVLEVLASGELSAQFDPRRVPVGESTELFIESNRANAEVSITSPQLTEEEMNELWGSNEVTLNADGQLATEFPAYDGFFDPGEYEFVFTDVDTGAETTAVLEVTSGETPTPVPGSGDMFAQFEPRQVQVGDGSILTIEGRPGADVKVSSPQLSTEQLQEVFPYEIALDEAGQFENDIGVPGFLEPGEYEFVFTDPETGAEATAVLEVTGDGGGGDGSASGEGETATPTPFKRGFFVNGEDGPLGPLSNFLNLTVLGFLLSVFGIFYQLMEGR